MDYSELATQLRNRAQIAIEPHWHGYQATTPHPTSDGFLFWLKQNRVIDADLFTSLHTSGSLDMTVAEPSLAYRATHHTQPGQTQSSAPPPPMAETAHYEVLGELGKGAMGEVHLARDIVLRRKVALKSILPEMQQNGQLLSRFLGEMQITAQLDHPFIVPIYGVEDGPSGGLAYAMKVVQGRELADLLDQTQALLEAKKPLPDDLKLEARLEVFVKVCDAIAYAHERGIVHRDLKPSNVMLGAFNGVYVMDWGIARLMGQRGAAQDQTVELVDAEGNDARQTTRTRVGSTIGTPIYMSPEQAAGKNEELDGRSDLYALGLILQEIVTLTRAIGGTTLHEVLTNAKGGKRLAPQIAAPGRDVPVEIQAIIEKATRFHPNDRYPSVGAFADDIRRYLRNEAISAKPDSTTQRAGRWISKNRIATLVMLLMAIVVGAGGAIGLLVYNRATVAKQHQRELRLAELQASSAVRAQELDAALQSYEAALSRMAGAVAFALGEDRAGEARFHFAKEFEPGPDALPGLVESKYYGKYVSFDWPVASLAPGTPNTLTRDRGTVEGIRSLAREIMIGSARPDFYAMPMADRDRAIADGGAPIARISLTLAKGAHLEFPGMAGAPEERDARTDAPYVAAIRSYEPVWGTPGAGRGAAITLPCSTALRDTSGRILGVMTIEVDLSRAVSTALAPPATTRVDASLLVDRSGTVVAQGDGKGDGPKDLGMPRVTEAVARGESGTMETERGGRPVVVTYQPLSTVDWYLITAADVGAIEAAKAPEDAKPGSIAARTTPTSQPAPPPVEAAPAPEPAPAVSAEPAASASAAPSASAPPALTGKMPTAPSAPTPPPEPSSPFDPWDKYKKPKKEP